MNARHLGWEGRRDVNGAAAVIRVGVEPTAAGSVVRVVRGGAGGRTARAMVAESHDEAVAMAERIIAEAIDRGYVETRGAA